VVEQHPGIVATTVDRLQEGVTEREFGLCHCLWETCKCHDARRQIGLVERQADPNFQLHRQVFGSGGVGVFVIFILADQQPLDLAAISFCFICTCCRFF